MRTYLIELGNYIVPVLIFFIAVLALLFLLEAYRKVQERNERKREADQGEGLYESLLSSSTTELQMLVHHESRNPVFITKNLERFLSVTEEEIRTDLRYLERALEDTTGSFFQRFENWDRTEALVQEFYRTKKKQWIRLTVVKCSEEEYDLFEFRDISEEKREREELQEKLAAATEESRSKLYFLSRMSHEIRTPMNGIIGMLTLMEAQPHTDLTSQYLEKAKSQSQYLLSLINDILDMSQIENEKLILEKKSFDLLEVAEEVKNLFQKNIEAKGIRFVLEIKDFDKHWVVGDQLRLTQVLVNFLSNAQKFTKEGEIRLSFRSMMQDEKELSFMIRVHDTGIGMNPDFVKRIFNPFEQEGQDENYRKGGNGLGMAITNQIVKLMGGEILVNTMLGKGTDFTIYLKLPLAEKPGEERDSLKTNIEKEEYSFSGKRILLAEDTEINAMIAEEILGKMGAEVELCENGKLAVDKYSSQPEFYYDFILMDIQMPVMDGREATQAIRSSGRKDAKSIPIFALSADAFVEDQRRSIEMGMNGHFTKPIDFDEMQKEISRFMQDRKTEARKEP